MALNSCYQPTLKPRDFDAFWENSIAEMGKELEYEVLLDSTWNNKRLTLNRIKSYHNVDVYCWVSEPIENSEFPVFVRFSGFERGNTNRKSPNDQWFLKHEQEINMIVDVRGQGLSTDQIGFDNYLTNGLSDKNKYIYKGAYLDAVKSIDFIANHPKSNGFITVMGGSQGGALSVAAAALNDKVNMAIIGFPFLTDIHNYDKSKWPMNVWIHEGNLRKIDLDELYGTLSYFDALNFADKVTQPVYIRTQETDTVTPKDGALKLFQNLKSTTKNIYIDPCEGHGCSTTSPTANDMEKVFIINNIKM